MTDYSQIQVRQDTSARWASINPILSAGEFGYTTDTKILKIGDGTTAWNSLPQYANKVTTLAGYGITDAYTKTQVDISLNGKANVGLDNLNSDGQMIIDSHNGTISNCILEIPQNILCSIESNVVTLASGSVLTNTGSEYATTTLTADQTYTISNSLADGNYLLCSNGSAIQDPISADIMGSGANLPADDSTYSYLFNTGDKLIYKYVDGVWVSTSYCYPFAEISMSSGVASFAKDSNGYDMIFNGAGFVGTTLFVYPNVKGLIPNGFNEDGSLKSIEFTTKSLYLNTRNGVRNESYLLINNQSGSISISSAISSGNAYYNKEKNLFYNGNSYGTYTPILSFSALTGGKIDIFAFHKPMRTATVEMLETKQADVTTLTGYDSTKTQTLKNINGVLTWVTD